MPTSGNLKYHKSCRKFYNIRSWEGETSVGWWQIDQTEILREYLAEGGLYVGAAGVGYMLWYLQKQIPGQVRQTS